MAHSYQVENSVEFDRNALLLADNQARSVVSDHVMNREAAGRSSAAVFASCNDGVMQALANRLRKIVNLMRTVDLDSLARGAERDLAVFTAAKVLL